MRVKTRRYILHRKYLGFGFACDYILPSNSLKILVIFGEAYIAQMGQIAKFRQKLIREIGRSYLCSQQFVDF